MIFENVELDRHVKKLADRLIKNFPASLDDQETYARQN